MKKLIALFTVMAMVSATVFAAPLSLAASLENGVPVKDEAAQALDLFADVGATQLSDTEAAAVEGEGKSGAIGGALVGAGVGGYIGMGIGAIAGNADKGMKIGAAIGAVIGGIAGFIWGP